MKNIFILLLILGWSLQFKSSIMAKTVGRDEDATVKTPQAPVGAVATVMPILQPTSMPVLTQPSSPPIAPTDIPVTTAPQPTSVPATPIPPTSTPIQPTSAPIVQPTIVPVVNNTDSTPPTSQLPQTTSPNVGGAPVSTPQTTETAQKLQSPTAADDYHAYNAVHTVPTPTPNIPVATALEQNAVTKPVAPIVRSLVNATNKIVDIPASLLFKQKPQQQYYKESRISTDASVTLLATAAILFFFGFVLANQRFSELFINKAKLVRSYLF